jgi:hypothetical protein
MTYLFVPFSFGTCAALFASVAPSLREEVELLSAIHAAAYHDSIRGKMEYCDTTANYELVAIEVCGVDFITACRHRWIYWWCW